MSWKPPQPRQWRADSDAAWQQAYAAHGAPSKLTIAAYRALLPGTGDLLIYGRGSYYNGMIALPRTAQESARFYSSPRKWPRPLELLPPPLNLFRIVFMDT